MSQLSRVALSVVFLTVLLCSAPCHAQAQAPKDTAKDAARVSELTLIGYPESDGSFTGRITLSADQAADALIFHPSDFHHEGDSLILPRTQIKLVAGGPALAANTAQDFDFKVTGIRLPGTYRGTLDFLQPNHGMSPVFHVSLELIIQEVPSLSVRSGSDSVRVQLTNCSLLRCFIGRWLASEPPQGHTLPPHYTFPLNNDSQLPFSLTGAVSAVGDTRHQETGKSVMIESPIAVPAVPIVSIPFQVVSGGLAPDHYTGEFRLRLPGKAEMLNIPLQLDVRDGPELAVLVLICGILLGRFSKYMNEIGNPQSDLLKQFLQLQSRAQQDAADYELLQHNFRDARMKIDAVQLDAAKSCLTTIDNRLTLLSRLRYLATLLTPRSDEDSVKAILVLIATARNNIALDTDPTQLADQIEAAVKKLPPPAGAQSATGANALEVAAAGAMSSAAKTAANLTQESAAQEAPPSWARRVTAFITGHSDALRADVTLWFLRPLAWMILILLLVATGFMQLYLKNPSFGANSISDYFGLLLWGMGSDVAGRTLTNFKAS
jgi:hypothetical protein